MRFIRQGQATAVRALCERLSTELASGKQVLWLVSGGSNVAAEVSIMQKLRDHTGSSLAKLTIIPMDERYGEPGHKDSNSEQLRQAGFLSGAAEWIDVLAHDVSFSETIEYYDNAVSEAMAVANVVVGQFGLGADGHVAGLLPNSPATTEDYATVVGYEWKDYVRLTLTPRALGGIDAAYVLAYGDSKQTALQRLQANHDSLENLPAKVLYDIKESYVFNDQIESRR